MYLLALASILGVALVAVAVRAAGTQAAPVLGVLVCLAAVALVVADARWKA